jgi:hypothetical protein
MTEIDDPSTPTGDLRRDGREEIASSDWILGRRSGPTYHGAQRSRGASLAQCAEAGTMLSRRGEGIMAKARQTDRWQQLRGAAKARWDRLTDHDVESVHGNIERLIEALRARYGYPRATAVREITDWSKALRADQAHA